jgi:hypothetical protein
MATISSSSRFSEPAQQIFDTQLELGWGWLLPDRTELALEVALELGARVTGAAGVQVLFHLGMTRAIELAVEIFEQVAQGLFATDLFNVAHGVHLSAI